MQIEFFNVPSPCIGVCEANPRGYCKGCWRSRDERQNWQSFSNSEKKQVINLCKQRKLRFIKEILLAKQKHQAETTEKEKKVIQIELFE